MKITYLYETKVVNAGWLVDLTIYFNEHTCTLGWSPGFTISKNNLELKQPYNDNFSIKTTSLLTILLNSFLKTLK